MNKKFFTLIAGIAMLAGLVGTANAQIMDVGTKVTSLPSDATSKLYQIGLVLNNGVSRLTTDAATSAWESAETFNVPLLLTVDKEGVLRVDSFANYLTSFRAKLGETLWCANRIDDYHTGGLNASVKFTNKANDRLLMVSPEDVNKTNSEKLNVNYGSQESWGLYAAYPRIEPGMPLYSYYKSDSVLVLLFDPAATGDDPWATGLYVARMHPDTFFMGVYNGFTSLPANRFHTSYVPGGGRSNAQNVLFATLMKPAKRVLNAEDFNTVLGTKSTSWGQTLKFILDNNKTDRFNPWSKFNLKATDVNKTRLGRVYTDETTGDNYQIDQLTGAPVNITTGAAPTPLLGLNNSQKDSTWVMFSLENGFDADRENDKYLYVDTAYSDSYLINGVIKNSGNLVFNFSKAPLDGGPGTAGTRTSLEYQYYFRLVYDIHNDSLGIDVASAKFRELEEAQDKTNGNYWSSPGTTTRFWRSYGSGVWYYSHPTATSAWTNGDRLHVKLAMIDQDSESPRLITIGTPYVYTYAQFGLTGCQIVENFESVAAGLYVIKNNKGQALGVPINTDSIAPFATPASKYAPSFINLDGIIEPQDMPSFQWVVKPTRTTSAATSPIELINREFPNIRYTVTLVKNGETNPDKAPTASRGDRNDLTKSYFTAVDSRRENPFLGYYYIPYETSQMTTYDLNYFHALGVNTSLYLGLTDDGTNRIVAQKGRTQFALEPVPAASDATHNYYYPIPYGYAPTKDDVEKLKIAQLKRQAYTLRIGGLDGKVLRVDNARESYTAGDIPGANDYGVKDYGVFLLKTNNTTKDGKKYYALLDTNSFHGRKPNWDNTSNTGYRYNYSRLSDYITGFPAPSSTNENPLWGGTYQHPYKISYTKLSIADGNIIAYANVQKEARTSAFQIKEYSAPLYRRFDGGQYTFGSRENADSTVTEPYAGIDTANAKEKNAPLFLRFYDIAQPWMYLYENSDTLNALRSEVDRKKNISFLGLQDNVHFPEGDTLKSKAAYYQFYVDTAFVKRSPDGRASEPYTNMPQYMLVVRPEIRKAGKIYSAGADSTWYIDENGNKVPLDESHWANKEPKDVPHLVRGMYLFNATDSVERRNSNYKGHGTIEGDIRLAFVEGVHLGDTFYVLPESYKTVSTLQIQLNPETWLYNNPNIPWYRKHYLGANTHYEPRWHDYDPGNKDYKVPSTPNIAGYTTEKKAPNGKSMVFQFRLRNFGENPDRNFFIESEWMSGTEIGPKRATFALNHNGAPVVSLDIPYDQTGIYWNDAALGLNVNQVEGDKYGDPKATGNEAAATAAPKVIGGAGSVTILNAAGKTITVTNVLGQTIATSVATGNSQTIALPKG
ncbi:MAG: DUF6383 domain-containing protein, partial [Tannerellaceae bacterium]|nr:DUF6383 domain-containing protein [Tannerellaceae bacterium]